VTLLAARGKTEEQAYAQLRQMAMAWRISFEDAATRIVASRDGFASDGAGVQDV
jgi:AmiR/NasT family two-component response regulator